MRRRVLTMISNIKSLLFLSLLALPFLQTSQVLAEGRLVVRLPGNNKAAGIDVPANTSSSTSLVFYYIAKGNISSEIGVEVLGPKGLDASVEAAQVRGSALTTLDKGKFWKIFLKGSLVESAKSRVAHIEPRSSLVKSKKINTRASATPPCALLPADVIKSILDNLSASQHREVTYDELCNGDTSASAGSGDSDVGNGSVELPNGSFNTTNNQPKIDQSYGSAIGFLEKDNCASIKDYLVRVTVKLNKVAAADLAQGFTVKAAVQESVYNGGRAASLKPVSDGKFAPRPLLLMESLGGGQWVNLVQWVGGSPRIVVKVAASTSIVYYRGYVLVRVVADKLLAGGRGEKINYELTNGNSIYNVCGRRARVRWRINGYPGS